MKNTLLLLIGFFIITQADAPGQQAQRRELAGKRTHFSKTYYDPNNRTFTAEISAGYRHYRAADGSYHDIDTNLRRSADSTTWSVTGNLYRVHFSDTSSSGRYDIVFELPRPLPLPGVRPAIGQRQAPPSRLYWKILGYGYFDRTGKQYAEIAAAGQSKARVAGNALSYPNLVPGIDASFDVGATRLKEAFVLSQQARDALPDPQRYGILRSNAYLMVQLEFRLTPNAMNAFARPDAQTKIPIKQGNRFDYEGDDRIEFEDKTGALHFSFLQDFAHAEADSATGFANRTSVRKYFYFDRGVNYLLAGVPLAWLDEQPSGDVVIDPTTSVGANDDVWLEDTGNKNSYQFIIVGKSRTPSMNYPKKRTVIEFDIAGSGIPSTANVINAQMKLYYYSAMRPTGSTDPWIDRWIQVHQLLVDWDEAQATKVKRLTSTNWNADWGAIDGTDADSSMESTVLFQQGEDPTWKSWNLTNVTQDWVDGSATNYGVILWATNEDTDGYEMRFRSSEYTDTTAHQPKLEVTYTEDPLATVFFLKDHLGSVRAVVDDTAGVVGYTDYDPWGYLLAGRVLETAWSGQNVAKKKFTGKEWDDDYDLNWFHFGARPYDPEIARWMSVDPLADKYPAHSPYNYALNNPIIFLDPDGREVRGSKEDLDSLATEINKGLQDAGLEDARVVVRQKEVLKEGAALVVALLANQAGLNVSLTETVYALEIQGEGWNALANEQTSTGSTLKDEALNMLSDLLRSPTVFDAVIEPHDRHREKLHTGGTLDDNLLLLDPKSEALERGIGNHFGLIMHELVGHGHPASPNAVLASEQGANIIGQAFGLSSIHDHLARPGKPGGGYRGYPVTLRPKLPPVPKK